MQSEKINFTYILHAVQVTTPVTVSASVNGIHVASTCIEKSGKFEFVVETVLEQGPAELSLTVGDTNKSIITVNSIKMQWLQENSNINPNWTSREAGPNEIWNYGVPATAWTAQTNALYHGTIMLDYEQDNRRSFLRSYATVSTGGQTFNLRDKAGAYEFYAAGSFTLPLTSPVSYWLMKRLFVEI